MIARFVVVALVSLASTASGLVAQVQGARATAAVQDFSETVVPIAGLKLRIHPKEHIVRPTTDPRSLLGIDVESFGGTGFCVDPECRFIGTNYHVALMGTPWKIKGERVVQKYLATGPNDEGARINDGGMKIAKFTLRRDLAIFELRHALRKHHGIGFYLDELELGQQVDIYAYPKEGINPFRRLLQFHGTFAGETTRGLLVFKYGSSDGSTLGGGASGGIVVDSKTRKIIGILNSVAKNGELSVYAVPSQELADFVSKVQPFLAQRLFQPSKIIPPVSADLYPKFVWPAADPSHKRPEEPYEVWLLRIRAQALVESMKNFIAVQSFEWGAGSADREPTALAAYEVQVLNNRQQFREYPDGNKRYQDNPPFPPLNTALVPASEWSELPKMVGWDLHLRIHQASDSVINGRPIKVFQYEAVLEDRVCGFRSTADFIAFKIKRDYEFRCHGEVWTDENTNILRISQEYDEPDRPADWSKYREVVTYGWFQPPGESDRLVPLTIATSAEHKKKTYWCRGQFTDYKLFTTSVKIVAQQPSDQTAQQ